MGGGGGGWRKVAEGAKPAAAMVLTQSVFGGQSILYKLSLNDGMDYKITVAYRYIFAAAFITPIAYFVERKQRRKLTWYVIWLSFFSGLSGGTLSQNLYLASMESTTATYATAIGNLLPSCTFLLAAIFRLEKVAIRTSYGKGKILGTLLGLGGATVMSIYKGPTLNLLSTDINLLDHSHLPRLQHVNQVRGMFLGVLGCLCYALWYIIQAKLAAAYPHPYSNATLMCWMASAQASIFAICFKRSFNDWRLGFDVRLLTATYAGIFASGMAFTLTGWCIRKKGPLYASVFSPLMLVSVAVLSSLLLKEKLSLGCLLGAVLIVTGLYIVVWGKGREASLLTRETAPATSALETVTVQETGRDPNSGDACCEPESRRELDKETMIAINGDGRKKEDDEEMTAINGDEQRRR